MTSRPQRSTTHHYTFTHIYYNMQRNQTHAKSSNYLEGERKAFALYTLQNRAIPSVCDGLKAAGRRTLWVAKSSGKTKTATLAGATLPIHPHATPESAINTLAAPYGNNIPLFKGYGAFGTMLDPTAYGAARYTSVAVSKFTEDVVFCDIDIVPMMPNYDDTLEEPVHFLPLVPTVLLNPSEGIAVGFATNILPRSLEDIINVQIAHLSNKPYTCPLLPTFVPTQSVATAVDGRTAFFEGMYEDINATTIRITNIPYGQSHDKVINKLDSLCDTGTVVDYTDRSKDKINIEVKFKKGTLSKLPRHEVLKTTALVIKHNENLNVLDFAGRGIWSTNPEELIKAFTDWRLGWYIKRYERLRHLLSIDLQRFYDIRCAIKNNVGGMARKVQNKDELRYILTELGVVHIEYIADLPVYRFTEEENEKNEQRIRDAESLLRVYEELLTDPQKRANIYIQELRDVLAKHKKGVYD